MKPLFCLAVLIIILSSGCSGAPFGRPDIPTARPLTATLAGEGAAVVPSTVLSQTTAVPLQTATAAPQPASSTPTPSATATSAPLPTPTPSPTGTPTKTPAPEPLIAVVANDFTNVYSGPGLDYDLLVVLTAGFQVELVGASANGSWLVVRLPRGAEGWVSSAGLDAGAAVEALPVIASPDKPAPTGTADPGPEVVVSPNALAPDAKYTITILNFRPHERVTVRIVFAGNGSLVFKMVVTARVDGTQELVLRTGPDEKEGAYLVTAAGDDGSFADTEFFVGPPDFGGD